MIKTNFNIKTIARTIVALIISILVFNLSHDFFSKMDLESSKITITIRARVQENQDFKIYFSNKEEFSEKNSLVKTVIPSEDFLDIKFNLPKIDTLRSIRLDPGTKTNLVEIKHIIFSRFKTSKKLKADYLIENSQANNDIEKISLVNGVINLKSSGPDPYLLFNFNLHSIYQKVLHGTYWIIPLFYALVISIIIFLWILKIDISQFKFNKISSLILVLGFVVTIIIPGYSMFFTKKSTPKNHEKRTLSTLPTLSTDSLFYYSSAFNSFFKDNFGKRTNILKWNTRLKINILKTSPIPDKLIVGKDDWLYFSYDSDPRYSYAGKTLTDIDLEKIKTGLEARFTFFKNKGIKFYIFIPPTKNTIYPEYLPKKYSTSSKSNLDQITNYMSKHSFIKIIDIREELYKAKSIDQVYYKDDTHWNKKGAYIGYKKIISTIAKDFPNISPISPEEITFEIDSSFQGDLSELLIENKSWKRIQYSYKYSKGFKSKNISTADLPNIPFLKKPPEIKTTGDTTKPNLIMYRDSYCNHLTPLISEHFNTSIFLWTYFITPEIIELEKPNIVIFEILERYLDSEILITPTEMTS